MLKMQEIFDEITENGGLTPYKEKLEKLVKGFLKKLLLETKNLEFGMRLITKSFGIKHNTLEML